MVNGPLAWFQILLIIIMEICKAPTLRLKALNKHTHIMYIEMENVIQKKEGFKHNLAMHTHTHTLTLQFCRILKILALTGKNPG